MTIRSRQWLPLTRPSPGCVKEHRAGLEDRCIPSGVVRLPTPVATRYCYRLRPKSSGLEPRNGRFTLRIMAERQGFEPWDR
jgi:hypothetical protein